MQSFIFQLLGVGYYLLPALIISGAIAVVFVLLIRRRRD
jgi:uncharacterized membrane protein SpoIIM required for sporulation